MMTMFFSNPRHHLDMMAPVAKLLLARGMSCRMISLAELRGLTTPDLSKRLPGVEVRRVMPALRRSPSAGAGIGTGGGASGFARDLVRRAAWEVLALRLRGLIGNSATVAMPNDVAYPYDRIATMLAAKRTPFALLQEGIRFPLPIEAQRGAPYGSGGASTVCVWGEASAAHFRAIGARNIVVTGNPRFDDVNPEGWKTAGRELAQRLGLERDPLVYLSNTIDDQGFCTTADKLALFTRFLRAAGPIAAREKREIVVKLHARESVGAFRAAAAAVPEARTHVVDDVSLFAVLAIAKAAVVLASTVGLEALAFGVPLGVLEIPGHGHVFDYVSSGAGLPLWLDRLPDGISQLLADEPDRTAARAFLDSHMARRGAAASSVADCLVRLSESHHEHS